MLSGFHLRAVGRFSTRQTTFSHAACLSLGTRNLCTAAVRTDFSGSQSKEEAGGSVVEQYDDSTTRKFYQVVMGGGGHDIHFGLFREETDGVKESSDHTTEFMLQCMDWCKPVTTDSLVLDVGSGHGGSTHKMVQKFGCSVQCINIGPQQNAMNADRCKELGIADRVDIVTGNLEQGLPDEWTGKFDCVWSCEVLCHIADKQQLLKHVSRVLKPGGVFVFSDIMGADNANEEALKAFTERNTTTFMGRPKEYLEMLEAAGLQYVAWWDNSDHLARYFTCQRNQILDNMDELLAAGITQTYLDNWANSLKDRADVQEKLGVFAWGMFAAKKPS